MANWQNIGSRGNVEDRRGLGPTAVGGGLGVVGLIVVLALNLLGGGDVTDVLTQVANSSVPTSSYNPEEFEGTDEYEVFASTVLGSNNEMWDRVFEASGADYTEPKLVLFRSSTLSSCGGASSTSGPHYCPLDQTIYLDETFFDELTTRLGAEGGDVAEAYVIAHEVGHHVQNLLGTISGTDSIKTELQADCYAGLWAHSIKDLNVFGEGEIREAMDAAAAVGDDRIQQTVTGRVNPETWTHGSSQARVNAFTTGFESGRVGACTQ